LDVKRKSHPEKSVGKFRAEQSTRLSTEGWAWLYILIIPALGKLRQEDREFKGTLGCTGSPCLKQNKKKKQQNKRPLFLLLLLNLSCLAIHSTDQVQGLGQGIYGVGLICFLFVVVVFCSTRI
jgi:hypothetical protein